MAHGTWPSSKKRIQSKAPKLKRWQAAWAKRALDRNTASKICPFRLAMGMSLFQLRGFALNQIYPGVTLLRTEDSNLTRKLEEMGSSLDAWNTPDSQWATRIFAWIHTIPTGWSLPLRFPRCASCPCPRCYLSLHHHCTQPWRKIQGRGKRVGNITVFPRVQMALFHH